VIGWRAADLAIQLRLGPLAQQRGLGLVVLLLLILLLMGRL
jgi:hypothetical protein